MKHQPVFFLAIFVLTLSANGQLSLKNPQICHDYNNYLSCYNDGSYVIRFKNGNFKEVKTTDGIIKYSDADKTLTFYQKSEVNPSQDDTVQIKQLPHSILLTKGASRLEISSLSAIPPEINSYFVYSYTQDSVDRGFAFPVGNRWVEIEIWTEGKSWSWNLFVKEVEQKFGIIYNADMNNRVESIIIQDDSLKYGMAVFMTNRTLRKVRQLISSYVALDQGASGISGNIIPIDNSYRYEYDDNGKLEEAAGRVRVCSCK